MTACTFNAFPLPSTPPPSHCLLQAVFVLGEMLLALLAYFIPDWKRLSLTCAGITAAYLISFVAAKESPRWLAMRVRVRATTDE